MFSRAFTIFFGFLLAASISTGCRRSESASSVSDSTDRAGNRDPSEASTDRTDECSTPQPGKSDSAPSIQLTLVQFDSAVRVRQTALEAATDSVAAEMFEQDARWAKDTALPHFEGVYAELTSLAGNTGGDDKDWNKESKQQQTRLNASGIRVRILCEGMADLAFSPGWSLRTFGKRLPEDYRSYLAMDSADELDNYDCDAGFTLSFDSIAGRALVWEGWAARHPNSSHAGDAIQRSLSYQRDLLRGEENTPVFEDQVLDSTNRVLWSKVVKRHPGTRTAATLSKALRILEAAHWKETAAFREWIEPTKRPCTFQGDSI